MRLARLGLLILVLAAASIAPTVARPRARLSWDGLVGRQRLLQQRWEAAAQAFQRAVDRGHAAPAEWEGLGYALLKAGRFAHAAVVYDQLCKEYPRKASFWVNLGLAYAGQEPADMQQAEKAFHRALELKPRDPNALLNMAVLLHRLGRTTEARGFYESAETAARRNGYVLTGLADLLRDQGNFVGAYWEYQQALVRQSDPAPTHLGLARLFYGRGARGDDTEAINHAWEFLRRTQKKTDRWARYRSEALQLIRRAEGRQRRQSAPLGPDQEPPKIELLWPDSIPTQQRGEFTCRVERSQFTVVGTVSDDRAISQVTVNGIYPDWFPVTVEERNELRSQIQEKGLILGKGLIRGKELFWDRRAPQSPGPQQVIYLFSITIPLPQPETPVRIAALDFGGHTSTLEFTVRRPRLALERGSKPQEQSEGVTWGVFVGVNHYPEMDVDPSLRSASAAAAIAPSLQYPASDAQRLYEILCDPARGCIAPSHAYLLHDLRADQAPTRARIMDCVHRLRDQVGPKDTVLFFFSGHGAVDGEGNQYLLTRDSSARAESWPQTALDRAALAELAQLRARQVVLFLDACHAGGVLGGQGTAGALAGEPYRRFLQEMGRSGRFLFAACGADGLSYEDTLGLRAGVFAYFLAEGLAGRADPNDDGVIELGELVPYVEREVSRWSDAHASTAGPPQRPVQLSVDPRIDLPLAFTPLAAARRALAGLRTQLSEAELEAARADLQTAPERAILAEWFIELADPLPGEKALTIAQYRDYRRVLREAPQSRQAQLYQRLSPRQAVLAIHHLPATEDPSHLNPLEQQWHEVTGRLLRGDLTAAEYADWMDGWLQSREEDER